MGYHAFEVVIGGRSWGPKEAAMTVVVASQLHRLLAKNLFGMTSEPVLVLVIELVKDRSQLLTLRA